MSDPSALRTRRLREMLGISGQPSMFDRLPVPAPTAAPAALRPTDVLHAATPTAA